MTKKEKIEKEILETLKNDKKDIYGSILYFIEKLKKKSKEKGLINVVITRKNWVCFFR